MRPAGGLCKIHPAHLSRRRVSAMLNAINKAAADNASAQPASTDAILISFAWAGKETNIASNGGHLPRWHYWGELTDTQTEPPIGHTHQKRTFAAPALRIIPFSPIHCNPSMLILHIRTFLRPSLSTLLRPPKPQHHNEYRA